MNIDKSIKALRAQTKSAAKSHDSMKEKLLVLIKEYLKSKHEQAVHFFPDDEEILCMLESQSFYPSSAVVFDTKGFSASSTVDTIMLKDDEFVVITAESGSVRKGESLLYEDLVGICQSIDKYEEALRIGIHNEVGRNKWKMNAIMTLLNNTGKTFENARDFVELYWQADKSVEYNIEHFNTKIR